MRRNMRHLIVGATASLFIVGCGITTAKKSEDNKKSDDAKGLSAGASVNNQQFSLSLPYLPDIKPGAVLKAHIRIFDSHVAVPAPVVDCAVADSSVSSPSDGTKPHVEQQAEGLGLTQRPVRTVYEDSVEYKAGASIGPIMLDPGMFTAILDIYDERGRRYSGTSWFDVKQKSITEIAMEMQYVNDCSGGHSSGVVITPVIPGQNDDLVSACEFMTAEIALCRKEEAICYYKEYKGHSSCGVNLARQSLIANLCKSEIKVPKSFESEILCESQDTPEPQPEPQPPKPSEPPSEPQAKVRACLQMDMPCDASDTLIGRGCSARYYIKGQALEQKIPTVNTGNYCKDRYQTLSALCDKRADDYKIQCLK